MPGNRAETRVTSQASLRDYWMTPREQHTSPFSERSRRQVQSPSSPPLVEHPHPLPMRPGTSLPPGLSQPALPLTWYEAEPAVSRAPAETPPHGQTPARESGTARG